MAEPQLRAAVYLSICKVLRTLPPETSAQVFAKIPTQLLERLAQSGASHWLSVGEFMPVYRAVHTTLAPAALEGFWRSASLSTAEQPLLAGALRLLAKLTGLSHRAVAKTFQSSWSLVSRDLGELILNDSGKDTGVSITWKNIPREVVREPAFYTSLAPSLCAAFELLGLRATGKFKINPAQSSGEFVFEWDA